MNAEQERSFIEQKRRELDYPIETPGMTQEEANDYADMLESQLEGCTVTHALVNLETMQLTGLQLRTEGGASLKLTFENPSRIGSDPLLENPPPRIVRDDEIPRDHQSMEGLKIRSVVMRVTHFTNCMLVHGILLEQGTKSIALFFANPQIAPNSSEQSST